MNLLPCGNKFIQVLQATTLPGEQWLSLYIYYLCYSKYIMPIILNSISNTYKYSKSIVFTYSLRANLALDISNSNLNNGVLADFSDLAGTGNWKIFEGNTSIASIGSGTASGEWTGGTQMVKLVPNISDYFWRYSFNTGTYTGTGISGDTIYDVFGGNAAVINGANKIETTNNFQSPSFGNGVISLVSATAATPPRNSVTLPSFTPDMTSGTTFSFWGYFDAAASTTTYSYLFSFGLFATSGHGVVRFGRSTSTQLNLAIYNNNSTPAIVTNFEKNITPYNNTWTHFTWVLTATSPYTWYLYENGVLASTITTNTIYLTNATYAANYFGRTNFNNTPCIAGRLDDFQMFKRALTADEAWAIFKQYSQPINYAFETADVTGTTVANRMTYKIYDGTLVTDSFYDMSLFNGASVVVDAGSRVAGQGYLNLVRNLIQYVQFKPIPVTASGLTIALWFRATTANTPLGSARIFDIRNPTEISMQVGNTLNTEIRYFVTSGPSLVFNIGTSIVDNTWRHAALTVTYGGTTGQSSVYRFYLNGVATGSPVTGQYPGLGYRGTYNLGHYDNALAGASNERFDGGIDDFRWFNNPLTDSEIIQVYNGIYQPHKAVDQYNKFGNTLARNTLNSLPAISSFPGQNLLYQSQTGYTVKANEITLSPGANNTYCIWTSPKTATYALDVSFADFGLRTDGVGFQIFTINANNTFKQQLFTRTVTSTALTDVGGSYLSIPRYLVSLNTGDKIYLRADLGVANTTNDGSVISALIYEQVAS